jgi:hypothetical protein
MPRTCEENLEHRAWASKPRHLPKPPPTPAQLLTRLLATTQFTRKVYPRIGRKALASDNPAEIREALKVLQEEATRLQAQANLVATILPILYAA